MGELIPFDEQQAIENELGEIPELRNKSYQYYQVVYHDPSYSYLTFEEYGYNHESTGKLVDYAALSIENRKVVARRVTNRKHDTSEQVVTGIEYWDVNFCLQYHIGSRISDREYWYTSFVYAAKQYEKEENAELGRVFFFNSGDVMLQMALGDASGIVSTIDAGGRYFLFPPDDGMSVELLAKKNPATYILIYPDPKENPIMGSVGC